ncbi:MAG: hypothetical protein F4137_05695 [Acidobacteria bacterium]|nr:hypothetical protein [Acidobacteriota bacterium]
MVRHPELEYRYITADDAELDASLRGETVEGTTVIEDWFRPGLLMAGRTGVLAAVGTGPNALLQPLAVVVHDEEIRRLCGRYATLRSDLSPLSTWCHLMTPATFEDVKGITHEPRFRDTVGAWSGVVIAEAMLLAGKSYGDLRFSACLATATYAIARSTALWENVLFDDAIERLECANRLCRGRNVSQRNESRVARVRSSLRPIWACLAALTRDTEGAGGDGVRPLVAALKALAEARAARASGEAGMLARPLLREVPEARAFEGLPEMTPEARLRLFDLLTSALEEADGANASRRGALGLVAGYLATVAAGGTTSLGLVEQMAGRFPELTIWAYLAGSVGERITWTSAFDGLGRLVARELRRPLRLDEAPTCDFAVEEGVVLADPRLENPLVHLRVKQSRLLSVALFPGVNVAIPVADSMVEEDRSSDGRRESGGVGAPVGHDSGGNLFPLLAEAVWPFIRPKVVALDAPDSAAGSWATEASRRSRKKRR